MQIPYWNVWILFGNFNGTFREFSSSEEEFLIELLLSNEKSGKLLDFTKSSNLNEFEELIRKYFGLKNLEKRLERIKKIITSF